MKYHIIIFGCQFNKSDAEKIRTVLNRLDYKEVASDKDADLIFVLSCSVRQSAIDRIYGLKAKWQIIRETRPLVTILSGCVLPGDSKKMADFFDVIMPITDLPKLPKILSRKIYDLPLDYFKIHPTYDSSFAAYVPIMTGCNNFCTYCVVPYTRGREISRSAKDVIAECRDLIRKGYKEITLLGQNVNSYKSGSPRFGEAGKVTFPQLLKKVDQIEGDSWLRFATSHPKDSSDELIKVMAQGKHIAPYLHLPVQAGDDAVLKRMNRHYTVKHYENLIKKLRKAIPEIALSTDIIVGFPGETREQFLNTVKLFKRVKFDMAYIAQYSQRAGTAAAKLKDNVSDKEKARREVALTKILKQTALAHNKKLLKKQLVVLVNEEKKGFYLSKTATFKTVKFASRKNLSGKFVKIKINKAEAFGLGGTLVY